eukprot:580449-Hanusia_phi.AAC.1
MATLIFSPLSLPQPLSPSSLPPPLSPSSLPPPPLSPPSHSPPEALRPDLLRVVLVRYAQNAPRPALFRHPYPPPAGAHRSIILPSSPPLFLPLSPNPHPPLSSSLPTGLLGPHLQEVGPLWTECGIAAREQCA